MSQPTVSYDLQVQLSRHLDVIVRVVLPESATADQIQHGIDEAVAKGWAEYDSGHTTDRDEFWYWMGVEPVPATEGEEKAPAPPEVMARHLAVIRRVWPDTLTERGQYIVGSLEAGDLSLEQIDELDATAQDHGFILWAYAHGEIWAFPKGTPCPS